MRSVARWDSAINTSGLTSAYLCLHFGWLAETRALVSPGARDRIKRARVRGGDSNLHRMSFSDD
jgi:hypothetical protein